MQIKSIPIFRKEFKRLSKKHLALPQDVRLLLEELVANPFQGTPLGKNCYKIRLKISSKKSGKSGGARVITHILIEKDTITLLAIYDKSEQGNISNAEIEQRLNTL